MGIAMAWASIYFFIHLAALLKEPKTKTSRRLVRSARDTTNTFFDAALVFAVSMLGAGVVRMASILLAEPDADGLPTGRAAVNAAYMSVFSVFPPLLLANVARTTAPHHTVRYALWAALAVLAAAIDVLIIVVLWGGGDKEAAGARESGLDDGADTLWAPCRLRRPVVVAFVVAHVVLWVNCLWQLAAMVSAMLPAKYKLIKEETTTTAEDEMKRGPREFLSDWRFIAKVGNGILCFAVGWVLLAVYHAHVRVERDFKPNANSWDFGQVLALATWATVFIDFLTRYLHHEELEQRHLKK
ncbi:hypothetical protein PG997_013602 [Apiospora hydei]|uniref:Uncharacterized protein n=1 Tax=Apiospora hydei TaxID=1337664 RepID=A0ABR1V6R1_9PEZI